MDVNAGRQFVQQQQADQERAWRDSLEVMALAALAMWLHRREINRVRASHGFPPISWGRFLLGDTVMGVSFIACLVGVCYAFTLAVPVGILAIIAALWFLSHINNVVEHIHYAPPGALRDQMAEAQQELAATPDRSGRRVIHTGNKVVTVTPGRPRVPGLIETQNLWTQHKGD